MLWWWSWLYALHTHMFALLKFLGIGNYDYSTLPFLAEKTTFSVLSMERDKGTHNLVMISAMLNFIFCVEYWTVATLIANQLISKFDIT